MGFYQLNRYLTLSFNCEKNMKIQEFIFRPETIAKSTVGQYTEVTCQASTGLQKVEQSDMGCVIIQKTNII